ncbi:hypothetical protein SSX86_011720 [Deinandra increscens subsp. villosa]|uniref:ent-kaurene synthase n=1 Tax=Deinandra increscens subsp. villosa TaxID=3103831 RepID=A0AAP0D360_9ASTR
MSTSPSSLSQDNLFSMNTLLHMIPIKLKSSNYLLWRNQMLPLFTYQQLLAHVDGTSTKPSETIIVEDKSVPNPALSTWIEADQRTVILLNSSLSEEAASEVLGLTTARQIWKTLEHAYSNSSVERVHSLRDSLRQLVKGNTSVSEYGRRFKAICDQLAAIGEPVADTDKIHWFLCGLGASFETFSTAIRASKPAPVFRDLLSQAESHEMFLRSLHGPVTPQVAFTAHSDSHVARGRHSGSPRGHEPPRGQGSRGHNHSAKGRGSSKRPPHCQLCRTNGHYASSCPNLHTYARQAPSSPGNLAKAFHAQCHVTTDTPDWHVDSGATAHMTATHENLDHSVPYQGKTKVFFGDGKSLPVTHTGTSTVSNKLLLRDILVIPHLTKNLLSVSKLTMDYPVDVLFSQPFFTIQDRKTKMVLAKGRCENGLYVLKDEPEQALTASHGVSNRASYELWHKRLGHVSFDIISILNKLGVLSVTSLLPKPTICVSCELSKGHKLPFAINNKRSLHVLDLIHCDLWGPAPVSSSDGYLYYVIFVDDHSRFTWFYPLKTKTGFYSVLTAFIKLVQTQCSRKIKIFQSDGGTEFVNHTVRKILEDNGTLHRLSCPYTPQQNGRAERKHRHIVETGLAMLFNAHMPAKYWVDAFTSATFIINRLPSKILNHKAPFELMFSQTPQYGNFRTYGCQVFPYLRDYSLHKLAPRSISCVFIGYSSQHKGYRCLDLNSSRIYITRHARFNEESFPFEGTIATPDISKLTLSTFLEDHPTFSDKPTHVNPTPPMPTPAPSHPCSLCPTKNSIPLVDQLPNPHINPAPPPLHSPTQSQDPFSAQSSSAPSTAQCTTQSQQPHNSTTPTSPSPSSAPSPSPSPSASDHLQPPSTSTHPMVTRSKLGIFKPKHRADFATLSTNALHIAMLSTTVPKGFKTAAKDPKWVHAMDEEMTALRQSNTWTLVPRPQSTNIVGSKWVYRIKYHTDGSVQRYKARLVAQGFTQIPGIDYSHTFSPVVKASTVRVVLSLAVLHKWRLHQLDVNNAFLNGNLNETVFMEQPPGYEDSQYPNHVCKLSKALYGLKQAPRAWFHRLSSFLLTHGFTCSRADSSLFVYTRDKCIMYLLVYVDDLILTGSNEKVIATFIATLNREFAIKDLGDLNYFLGLEVAYTDDGLFLTQSKYATDILRRAGLLESKPASTPLAPHATFTSHGPLFNDPSLYRSLVGALQYLTITRPDLSYAVNQVSQFLHAPTIVHFEAVKRILRYVKGTIPFGLTFTCPRHNSILGYSDADWARCIETRRSTYGYSIFLGGNLVSWSAKKQPTVSRSSCESEYRAMANTAAEIIWITHLLQELHALPPDRPTLLCDNKSAIFMSQNPVSHKRAKHIDLDYHFIRELVTSGKLHTKFVPTNLQSKILYQNDKMKQFVEIIKAMFSSMNDGEISISAYDTAWVALVQDVNGSGSPQFPSSLEWIANNQLSDGSWGDRLLFSAHDRTINTLACVIALTSWNVHPSKCKQGLKFLKENIYKLEDEKEEHMPIGFEVAFPSLIDIARKLKIEVPDDSPALKEIYARRNVKLTKIPMEVLHKVPTTLLYSLEGMQDLKWEKLLKLQCKDGSFLFSPSSTAFALVQTKDDKCLQYLTNIVTKFNGAVPNVYPVDLFEHIWVVDRLQRLGISRYFDSEIKDCVEYIYKYWTKNGICWAKNSNVQDLDDTVMGFRLLRMHGYEVYPDAFRQFEKDGTFVCNVGQSTQSVTAMFNLYSASQVLFPGEQILVDAKKFSHNYLTKKQSANKLLDKWIIAKDLPGEVGYALDIPWYASLPRLETRYYLEQYGGEDDVWIGKTLYRMENVSNNTYLEMAKLDYNNSLAMHQLEWNNMQQWYVDFGIEKFGTNNITSLLVSYFLAAASIFEPEMSKARIVWAKTAVLVDTITSFFESSQLVKEDVTAFVDAFRNKSTPKLHSKNGEPWHEVMVTLKETLHEVALDALVGDGQDIHPQLHHAWEMWLTRWQDEVDVTAELMVRMINITTGRRAFEKLVANPQYQRLSTVTNNLCHEISKFHNFKDNCSEIDLKMQELVRLVFSDTLDDLDWDLKQTFLTVAKTFYYKAYCDPKTINAHISKVLFEVVI